MKAELYWQRVGAGNLVRNLAALTKPRVVLLHLVTTAAAMFLAAGGWPPLSVLLATLAGGGMVAGASNALNCYFDREIDKMMPRTRRRPLPAGLVNAQQALIFAVGLALAGAFILIYWVGVVVAALAVAALAYYVGLYTLWLKRHSTWSTVIGSGAGAFPPVIGWLAVTGRIEFTPFLLFAIVALWSPPHFWSLAIFRQQEYEKVGLAVTPARRTPLLVFLFSLFLVAASLWLIRSAGLGLIYAVAALFLGFIMLVLAWRLKVSRNLKPAHQMYWFSILYLFLLFSAMLTDRLVLV
jgi:protoheme IX farnesyltransferase